jgi:N-acetylmuramoyl-L-alanine amidase
MTTRLTRFLFLASAITAGAAACAPRGPAAPPPVPTTKAPVPVAPAPLPAANAALPPVPHVAGPLEIKVVYPTANQLIESKDSNFIFGSVGNGDAALTINGVPTPVWPNGAFMGWLPNPSAELSRYDLVATIGDQVARLSHPVKIQAPGVIPPPGDTLQRLSPAQYASLIAPATVTNDTDRVVTAYALTGGIQRWFLIPGTVVKVVSLKGPDAYVELDSAQTVRIAKSDLNMLTASPAAVAPMHVTQPFRVVTAQEWTDVVIPVSERPAYLVDEGGSSLTLTLYGTSGTAQPSVTLPAASYLASVASSVSGPEMRYAFTMRGPIYGYQPLWQDSTFVLRIRRPPTIDAVDPLKGLTIAIDPGHPPVGATGPTGLWEPVPTLAVGLKVRDMLAARGVNVLMTRTTPEPVDLNLRPTMARRANAHALVSIHLNAVGDGTNPFVAEGTTTYHYWMHSEPLAAATHQALLSELSLPDKGVKRQNFALVRPTWMPAILCEGAFIIMPDQESALRTAEYQERYARGIVQGLETYFRSLGQTAH